MPFTAERYRRSLQPADPGGIIHRKGQEFFFTSPVFTKVLQQAYDLNYLLRKVKEEGYARA
jgi:hypothetical protein